MRITRPLPRLGAFLLGAALAFGPGSPGRAQTPAPEPAAPDGASAASATSPVDAPAVRPWYEEIAVNAFVSASYSYNLNRPASGTNQLRVFDFDDDSIKLDVAELVIQHAAVRPGDVGFRVDAEAGASIPRITAARGLFRDPETGKAGDFDLQQAFVTWIAPVGKGLRLDAGKMVTIIGYEVIEGYDGWNDNATRSILFGFAEPATHTGLKATYALSDAVTGTFLLVNGWDNVKDDNSSKTVALGLTLAPAPGLTLTANYMTGPERADTNGDPRHLLDVIAQWKPTASTTVGLNVDWGTENGAVAPGETATWWGAAGYLRLGLTSALALSLRGEYFDDADGARTGVVQRLKEVTLTPEVKLTDHLVFRADLRIDFSDRAVFEDADGALTKKEQPTLLLNALYAF